MYYKVYLKYCIDLDVRLDAERCMSTFFIYIAKETAKGQKKDNKKKKKVATHCLYKRV